MTGPGDCRACAVVTGVLLTTAMAMEITGPPRSFLFCLRLPALILAFGLGWAEARRRWGAAGGGSPVPMATPCLVLTSMLGTAAVAAKLTSMSPALAGAVLLTAAACCCLAAGLLLSGRRRIAGARDGDAARPRKRARPLAGGMPGNPVRPVSADA